MKAKRLGRGVEALLGEESSAGMQMVHMARITPGTDQPRHYFDDEKIGELAQSIREQGIIQPIVVEVYQKGFRIVAGERRFRAAQQAGLQEIPVLVRKFTERKRREIALTENLQREDLNPIEEAQALQGLLEMGEMTHDDLANRLGMSRSAVTNGLRLLQLSADIQDKIIQGTISAGHARALLSLKDQDAQKELAELITQRGISVREAEDWRSTHKTTSSKKTVASPRRDATVKDLEEQLIRRLGTKVQIRGNLRKGIMEISFFSVDELNRLIELLRP